MSEEKKYTGSFHKDVKEWLNTAHSDQNGTKIRNDCEKNADAIANLLKRNIRISKDFKESSSIPGVLLDAIRNPNFRYMNRQAENVKIFHTGKSKEDQKEAFARYQEFLSLAELIKMAFTQMIDDHRMTIHDADTNQIVGYMISPYVDPRPDYLMDVNGILSYCLSELLKNLMRLMAPESLERYDVYVLPPQHSVYYPGLAASVLFLKK